jgi:hypothetical protein
VIVSRASAIPLKRLLNARVLLRYLRKPVRAPIRRGAAG